MLVSLRNTFPLIQMSEAMGTFRVKDLSPIQKRRYQKLMRYKRNCKGVAISDELFKWIEDAYVQQDEGNSSDFLLGEMLAIMITDYRFLRENS